MSEPELARDIRKLVAALRQLADRLECLHRLPAGPGSPPIPAGLPRDVGVIVSTVADFYELTPELLASRVKREPIVWARQVAMAFAYEHTAWSLESIGEFLGGRDPGTVRHAIAKVSAMRETDRQRRTQIDALHAQLTGNAGVAKSATRNPQSAIP